MKPVSASIVFSVSGKEHTCDLLKDEIKEFFSIETDLSDEGCKITLDPKNAVEISSLKIDFPYQFDEKDSIFMNGYQSWTVTKEYSIDTTNLIVEQVARLMKNRKADPAGDRNFTHYPKLNRWLHGVSYGYIRNEKAFRFFGSLNEKDGFTFFDIDTEKGLLSVRKDFAGKTFDSAFTAFDLVFLNGTEAEVFDGYFEKLGVESTKAHPLTGYTTWYRHQQDISEKKILADLNTLCEQKHKYNCQLFCIDEGYETHIGDWLSLRKIPFPHGMQPITSKIMSSSMSAGIWIAPFICDRRSRLYREHPDWILRDADGKPVLACRSFHTCYCLDTTNEEFLHHLKNILVTMRDDWGISVFKFDFLYAACAAPSSGKTRGEKMFDAVRFLKECVGDSTTIGCGVPLLAAAGIFDYCQVGCDYSPDWYPPLVHAGREQNSTYRAVLDTIYHRQLAGRAFTLFNTVTPITDTHFLFSREKRDLLVKIHGLTGGMVLTSDDVSKYNSDDQILWNTLHSFRQATVTDVYTKDRNLVIEYTLYDQPRILKIALLE
ncbi:MAG: alpha-galactosidase [Clostridiales bacterium]|nr:alpha-galactosidase [Clostridiales bacterium]